MTKRIEAYKGDDARKIKCVKTYTVQDGHENTSDATVFQAGRTYSVSPGRFMHLIRKTEHFVDPDRLKREAVEEEDREAAHEAHRKAEGGEGETEGGEGAKND